MNGEREMSECEYSRKISAAYDGELPEDERQKLKRHVQECTQCRRELREMRALSNLLGGLEAPSMSPDFLPGLHSSLSETQRRPILLRTARRLTAVAATILVGSVVWLWQFDATGESPPTVPPQWERLVVVQEDEGYDEATREELLAEWIVEDLSREGEQ